MSVLFLTFSLFLISSNVSSKVVVTKTTYLFDSCIKLIFHNPITYFHHPHFQQEENKQKEVLNYCRCQSDAIESLVKTEKANGTHSKLFPKVSDRLELRDQCALKSLDEFYPETLYNIYLTTQMDAYVEDKIKVRYSGIQRAVASKFSKDQKFSCLKEKLYSRCGKIKSLATTYSCLKTHFKDINFFASLEQKCPEFSPEEVIEKEEGTYL
ncbi:MAG: hypothetical protein ACPGJV_11945 [Bacteriovoracaceae bacterium]